jgi:hypothetical protein
VRRKRKMERKTSWKVLLSNTDSECALHAMRRKRQMRN